MANEFDSMEEEDNITFRKLLTMVTDHKELIVTIAKEDEAATRRGLTRLKGRDNQKFKGSGLLVPDEVLSYDVIPIPDDEDNIKLHIKLGPRQGVKLLNIEIPDDKL